MTVIDFFDKCNIESFENKSQKSKLDVFDFDNKMLLYFDLEKDNLNNYIDSNYLELKNKFSQLEISFLYFQKIQNETQKIKAIFNYYLPQLNEYLFANFNQLTADNPFYLRTLLEDFGYYGSIKTGFIFKVDHIFYVIECNENDFLSLEKNPIEKLYCFFEEQSSYEEEVIYNSRWALKLETNQADKPKDLFENLDFETIEKIKQIEQQLKELKSQGQLLFVLPVLKQIIAKAENEIDLSAISNIHIGDDYRILLPYFNNLEIKFSHLTKAIYILFCNHPNGINIKELYRYKADLKDLYLNISNQLDYDKMNQSLEDIINPNSKSIYTHISRIKSAFYSVLDKSIADNYIIDSDYFGQDYKYIKILTSIQPPISNNDCEALDEMQF